MMGPAHSLSGAAAWLGVGAVAARPRTTRCRGRSLLVGALICAGAALAPDLDHQAATISRAFGPLSRALCKIVDKLAHATYKATRKQGDPRRSGGHRTLTHTWLWAVLIGGGLLGAAVYGGRWAVLAILFVHMVLAVEGLLWRAGPGLAATCWCGCSARPAPGCSPASWTSPATARTGCSPQPGQHYLWIGLPIVLGALVHCIGDALTVSGCPVLWPIPIGRKRWYPIGPPKFMRFRAGSWVELKVLTPVFFVVGGGCAALGVFG